MYKSYLWVNYHLVTFSVFAPELFAKWSEQLELIAFFLEEPKGMGEGVLQVAVIP